MTNSMGDSPIDGTTGDSPIHHMMGYSPDEEEPGNSPPVGSQDGEELSDESSRGVEIHIEEETTPIYKQRIIVSYRILLIVRDQIHHSKLVNSKY